MPPRLACRALRRTGPLAVAARGLGRWGKRREWPRRGHPRRSGRTTPRHAGSWRRCSARRTPGSCLSVSAGVGGDVGFQRCESVSRAYSYTGGVVATHVAGVGA
eukprot:scaffold4389_cov92-Isochrysis_galbana.AAC.2